MVFKNTDAGDLDKLAQEMDRDPRLDNAKFILIFLVVLGHLLEPLANENGIVRWLYMCIYLVHMPAFIFVAGLLSRSRHREDEVSRLVHGLLIPWLVFSIIYEGTHICFFGQASHYLHAFRSYWILWFLPCLFVWRLLLPGLLRIPFLIPISIVISILAGSVEFANSPLDVARLLYFLPFFLMGHQFGNQILQTLSPTKFATTYSYSVIAAGLTFAWLAIDQPVQWLHGSSSFSALGSGMAEGLLTRATLLAISTFCITALLAIAPSRNLLPASITKNTLPVYLWHGIAVMGLISTGGFSAASGLPIVVLIPALILVSMALTLALSNPQLALLTERLTSVGSWQVQKSRSKAH